MKKQKWWRCRRMHLRALKPMCEVLSSREDTRLICRGCPHYVRSGKVRKALVEKVAFSDDPALLAGEMLYSLR